MELTLPGDLPGLLRRGSPVWFGRSPCVVLDFDEADAVALVASVDFGHNPDGHWMDLAKLALDLADATGRTHAAWWALGKCHRSGWPDLHTGARLWLDPHVHSEAAEWDWARRKLWEILRNAGRVHDVTSDLDLDDPRILPDGSRWVDTEALRRVCLHVAGRM